jgi:thymidine kinase
VHKVHAICACCGATASYTQRLTESKELVVVGAADVYEARCRRCHEPEGAVAGASPWLFDPIEREDEEW